MKWSNNYLSQHLSDSSNTYFSCVIWDGSRFITSMIKNNNTELYKSSNGKDWKLIQEFTNKKIYSIAFNGKHYVMNVDIYESDSHKSCLYYSKNILSLSLNLTNISKNGVTSSGSRQIIWNGEYFFTVIYESIFGKYASILYSKDGMYY